MINWKNTSENLILTLAAVVAGVFIGYFVSIKVASKMIEDQKSTIEMAIRKETTAINNTLVANFEKIKSKKAEPINIIIDPNTKSVITSDTINFVQVKQKKGFFKRLFSKQKK